MTNPITGWKEKSFMSDCNYSVIKENKSRIARDRKRKKKNKAKNKK